MWDLERALDRVCSSAGPIRPRRICINRSDGFVGVECDENDGNDDDGVVHCLVEVLMRLGLEFLGFVCCFESMSTLLLLLLLLMLVEAFLADRSSYIESLLLKSDKYSFNKRVYFIVLHS